MSGMSQLVWLFLATAVATVMNDSHVQAGTYVLKGHTGRI